MELKILNKQGQSFKAIARVSGAARNTVRKYVRDSATAACRLLPRAPRRLRTEGEDLDTQWKFAKTY